MPETQRRGFPSPMFMGGQAHGQLLRRPRTLQIDLWQCPCSLAEGRYWRLLPELGSQAWMRPSREYGGRTGAVSKPAFSHWMITKGFVDNLSSADLKPLLPGARPWRWSIAGDRQSRLFVCGNPHSLVRNPQPDYEEVVLMNDCWYEEAVGLDD